MLLRIAGRPVIQNALGFQRLIPTRAIVTPISLALAATVILTVPATSGPRFSSYIRLGERFAPLTRNDGQDARVTLSNVLEPAAGKESASCPLLVRFFDAGGELIGRPREISLGAGNSLSVAAGSPTAGLVRAIVSIKDGVTNPEEVCAVQTTFEIYDEDTGVALADIPNLANLNLPPDVAAQLDRVTREETLAPVTVRNGQGIRVTLANVLIPASGTTPPAACPLLVRFFAADGSIIGRAQEMSIKPGVSSSVAAISPPAGVTRAIVSLKEGFDDPDGVCAIKTALETYAAKGATLSVISAQQCLGAGRCSAGP